MMRCKECNESSYVKDLFEADGEMYCIDCLEARMPHRYKELMDYMGRGTSEQGKDDDDEDDDGTIVRSYE